MGWMNKQDPDHQFVKGDGSEQTYYLLYEEPVDLPSQVEFDQWSQRIRQDAECHSLGQFGISFIEECQRI